MKSEATIGGCKSTAMRYDWKMAEWPDTGIRETTVLRDPVHAGNGVFQPTRMNARLNPKPLDSFFHRKNDKGWLP